MFSQVFVDEILVQGRQHWLRPLLLGMAIAAILQGILTLLRLRYLRRLKVKLSVGMSSRFLWHILRLPVGFYAQRFAGEISNRTSLNHQVADVLSVRAFVLLQAVNPPYLDCYWDLKLPKMAPSITMVKICLGWMLTQCADS